MLGMNAILILTSIVEHFYAIAEKKNKINTNKREIFYCLNSNISSLIVLK